ncbi:phage major capsid protein [Rhizobium rhizogenes]|uniref:phage major capsid protein n=1 Tax=Rhizobium rhizogenes TaxID=359 RepID=UPI00157349A8|nr:hypothetical protein [Rhizobium rhizogenes]NTF92582.1 hypothetical protein [Rhizobium rhizogenes]
MKKAAYVFATVAAFLCFGLAFVIISADPSHAATLIGHDSFLSGGGITHMLQASPALFALRSKLGDLSTRAEKKRGELVDGLSTEAARAIEQDHAGILAEIEQVRSEITTLENAARATPVIPPSNANADAAQQGMLAERTRSTTIDDLASRAGLADFGREHVRAGTTVDAFRSALFEKLFDKDQSVKTDSHVRAQVGQDETETTRAARIEALAYGLGAPIPTDGPSAAARQYTGQGLIDVAADSVNFRGRRMLNARDIDDIFTRASHATSDFPAIFEGAVNRTLEQRYALAQPTFRRFARKKNFRDFRPDTIVRVGDFPMLKKVLENGEIKYGTFGEGKESVQAFSYAIALNISRPMLINDDLGAISDLLTSYGASVALFEEVTFYAGAYNGSLADGKSVFHADHRNLGAASAITVDSVGDGRKAMSKQRTIDDKPMLANPARIMLVGPDQLTNAEKFLASITPATVSSVNIFSGKFELVETSQIEGPSWDLFADPSTGSNYRWGFLDGYEAPRVRMDEPFGRQGFSMSVEHDFGCGATDFRFGYHNPGKLS